MKYLILAVMISASTYNLYAQSTTSAPTKKGVSPEAMQKIIALAKSRETKLIGTALISFAGLQSDNSRYDVNASKGKIIFLHFWDDKNPMSIAQMDGMSRLYKKLKDSANIEFVTITAESAETIEACVKKYDMPYRVVQLSKEKCFAIKQESNVPTNMIIDRKGIIRYMKCGGHIDADLENQFVMGTIYTTILNIYNQQ